MKSFSIPALLEKSRLNLSEQVVQTAEDLLKDKDWLEVAVDLGFRVEEPQYLDLAGAMLIEHSKFNGPESMEDYLSTMKNRLDPEVYDFMENNANALQAIMERFEHLDYAYSYFSATVLVKQYLAKPSYDEEVFESPAYFYMRVITGIFYDFKNGDPGPCDALGFDFDSDIVEIKEPSIQWIEKMYEECVYHRISFATPTLYASGFKKSQKASCFLLQTGDDLSSIMHTIENMAKISQHRGGIGVTLDLIRHSNIGDVGMSSGIHNLVLLYDRLIRYVDQTGIRSGAATLYLRPQHPDIIDFIDIVDKDERSRQECAAKIDNAIWFNWMFLKRMKGSKRWLLFCPSKSKSLNHIYGEEFIEEYERLEALYDTWKGKDGILKEYIRGTRGDWKRKLQDQIDKCEDEEELKELKKRMYGVPTEEERNYYRDILGLVRFTKETTTDEIIEHIVTIQQKFGKPYLLNGDAANMKSNQKNLGMIRCSNLCVEIIEYTAPDEVATCNLGSLALGTYVDKDEDGALFYNFDKLGNNTRMMIMALNRVIDSNYYPIEEARNSNLRHRPIGLGVCGWGDVINQLRLSPDDDEASSLKKKVAACIYYNALVASAHLARIYGSYSTFEGSPLQQGKFQFDLWQDEHKTLERLGLLNPKIRKWEDQLPIQPTSWGQRPIDCKNKLVLPTWEHLRLYCQEGMYNSLLIARMPTASSASLSGSTESDEILSANVFSRGVLSGTCTVVNRYLFEELRDLNLLTRDTVDFIKYTMGSVAKLDEFIEKFPHKVPQYVKSSENDAKVKDIMKRYRTIFEISQKVFIRQAAQAAIYIDQSHSFNLWMPDPSKNQLKGAFQTSFDIGLKTLNYYVRRLPAVLPNAPTVDPKVAEFANQCRNEIYFGGNQSRVESNKTAKVDTKTTSKPVVECTDDVCLVCQS